MSGVSQHLAQHSCSLTCLSKPGSACGVTALDLHYNNVLDTHVQSQQACGLIAVVASEKGVVVGRLTFREDGDLIDCQRMGVGGKAIPPNVDKVGICLASACLHASGTFSSSLAVSLQTDFSTCARL